MNLKNRPKRLSGFIMVILIIFLFFSATEPSFMLRKQFEDLITPVSRYFGVGTRLNELKIVSTNHIDIFDNEIEINIRLEGSLIPPRLSGGFHVEKKK